MAGPNPSSKTQSNPTQALRPLFIPQTPTHPSHNRSYDHTPPQHICIKCTCTSPPPKKNQKQLRSYDHIEHRLREAGALTQAGPSIVGAAFAHAAAAAVPGLTVVGPHSPPTPPVTTSSGGGGDGKGRGQEDWGSAAAKPASSSSYYLTPESYAPMCYVARRRRPHPTSTQTLTRVSPFEARSFLVLVSRLC